MNSSRGSSAPAGERAQHIIRGATPLETTVVAPPRASDPIRLQLLGLVEELLLASKGNAAVCLRFGEDELPSVSADRAARALQNTARAPRRATTTRGV
jgi:hypothetical protein